MIIVALDPEHEGADEGGRQALSRPTTAAA